MHGSPAEDSKLAKVSVPGSRSPHAGLGLPEVQSLGPAVLHSYACLCEGVCMECKQAFAFAWCAVIISEKLCEYASAGVETSN